MSFLEHSGMLRRRPDFVFLLELHSAEGRMATWQPPTGYRLWTSLAQRPLLAFEFRLPRDS